MTDGIASLKVEGFDVWCLEDGTHVFDAGEFPGLAYDEQQTRLEAAGLDDIKAVFNAFLLRDEAGEYTLIDTGCGALYGDKGGQLAAHLAALGVAATDIKHLIFTHLHGDHCGGALLDGAIAFPNADVIMHQSERDYWATQDHFAAQVISAYADRTRVVADDDEIAPGVRAWHLPGHTPGHMGLRIGVDLVILADIVHSEALQMGEPRLSSENDHDAWQAAETRLDALREVAQTGVIMAGSHLMGPAKFTRLVEIGDGFIRVGL